MGVRFKDLATSTSTVSGDDYLAIDGLTNGTRKILANTFMLTSTALVAAQMPALTGDVTNTAGSLATTIANNAVSLAKMAQMATASFLGRNTAGTGNVEVLSAATAKGILGIPTSFAFTANTTGFALAGGSTTVKTLTVSNTLTLSGTDGSTLNIGGGGTLGSAAFTASSAYAGATGSGASGTWAINVTGSAGSVSGVTLQSGLGTGSSPSFSSVTAGSFNVSSSLRYKDNITLFSEGAAVSLIRSLRPVVYDRKDGSQAGEIGLIAEEVDVLLPQFVKKNPDGTCEAIDYSRLTSVLIAAVQSILRQMEAAR